jgi:hypothetical protein
MKALGKDGKPGPVTMEIVADQPGGDPWFVRRSAPFTVEVVPPFIDWVVVSQYYTQIPMWRRTLDLGAVLHSSLKDYAYLPDFESPPKLRLIRERFKDADRMYHREREEVAEATPENGNLRYAWRGALPAAGNYRYSYELSGATKLRGPFVIASRWYEMRVRFPWPEGGITLLLLLMVLSSTTVRLRGRLTVTIGYVPADLHKLGTEPHRGYSQIVSTAGEEFSILEALRFWEDFYNGGGKPLDIKLIGFNGGDIAAVEYRLALALGVTVGIVRGSGREADRLLEDPLWKDHPRLRLLEASEEAVGRFLSAS